MTELEWIKALVHQSEGRSLVMPQKDGGFVIRADWLQVGPWVIDEQSGEGWTSKAMKWEKWTYFDTWVSGVGDVPQALRERQEYMAGEGYRFDDGKVLALPERWKL